MMKVSVVLVLLFPFIGISQSYDYARWDVLIGAGAQYYRADVKPIFEFAEFLPSEINGEDISGFSSLKRNELLQSDQFSVLFGRHLMRSDNGVEQRLRIGFTFGQFQSSYNSYQNNERIMYDTLFSQRLQEFTRIDSVNNKSLNLYFDQEFISLDLSYILKSNTSGRWGFYGGLGLDIGIGFNSKFTAEYIEEAFIDSPFDYGKESSSITNFIETTEADPSFSFLFYIPAAVEFQLAKTSYFWSRTHLVFELRPGLRYFDDPAEEVNIYTNWSFRLGFRYTF